MTDVELEARIQDATCALQAAKTKGLQRFWTQRQAELIAMRSPETVERMEHEKGLRP